MKKKKLLLCLLAFVIVALSLSGCSNSHTLNGMKYKIDGDHVAITSYTDKTTVNEIEVPDEIDGLPVTVIADFGICNAESLKKITIGKNVEKIESWSMTNNQRLEAFEVSPENEHFTAVDGILFSKDEKTLVYYPPAKEITFDKFGTAQNTTTYAIPDGVETIASKAFYKCYYVNITAFPNSIKRIEEKAFHRTSELTDFTMPSQLEFIGKDAFAYDEKLTKLSIPSTIQEIDEYAFFNCTGMQEINIAKKESAVKLGKKWQPTEKGRIKKDCVINFQ